MKPFTAITARMHRGPQRVRVIPWRWWRIHAVVRRAQRNESSLEFLWTLSSPWVLPIARAYYAQEWEEDDWVQEVRIGWWKAVQTFQPGRGIFFGTWAKWVVRTHCHSALRGATRYKHLPLNTAISLAAPVGSDPDSPVWEDRVADPTQDPLDALCARETRTARLAAWQARLTPWEWIVLWHRVAGDSYATIQSRYHCSNRQIDNAWQRVRRKVRQIERSVIACDR
ncbi:sigma-70 family RNA polymerase sigma factor [Sulfobacillus thermosulfidooxidans]|uniref:sigma-70 family RNA polymerase sigma factor n=1 Tax=Sulfobacillus thermosulfidooxidans TaxID=28034 RepID=UPI0006B3FE1A|nr:sigma-70 family RNA polymerase sigma factor [Sulfobacillus thermosulfidooxidans]